MTRVSMYFAVLGALVAVPAAAQQPQTGRPQRPTTGLFGGGVGETTQALTLNVSFGGAYDDDLTPGGRAPRSDGMASASLSYSLSREFGRLRLGATASSAARYYPAISDDLLSNHFASGSASLALTGRTVLATTQRVSYTPRDVTLFYQSVTGGGLPISDPSLYIDQRRRPTWDGTVSLRQQLTRRASAQATYSRTQTALTGATGSQAQQRVHAGLSYSLTRDLNLRLGYGLDLSKLPSTTQSRWRARTIDAGVDFGRALSLTRRTSLTFGSGVTGLDNQGRTRYVLTGNAQLQHELGRSWTLGTSYWRQVQFIDAIVDPLIGDAVTASVGGLIAWRLRFNASVGGRAGELGVGATAPKFRSTFASTGLNMALSRYLAINATYSYSHYRFDQSAVLPTGIPSRTRRQSVQVNVTTWLPLLLRTRRP